MNSEPPTEAEAGELLYRLQKDGRSVATLIFGIVAFLVGWRLSGWLIVPGMTPPAGDAHAGAFIGVGFICLGCFQIAANFNPRRLELRVHRRGVWVNDSKRSGGPFWISAAEIKRCRVDHPFFWITPKDGEPLQLPSRLIDLTEITAALGKMKPPAAVLTGALPLEEPDEEEEEEPAPCLSCGAPLPEEATRCAKCGWSFQDQEVKAEPDEESERSRRTD